MLKIKKKHVVYLVFICIVLGSLLIGLYSYNAYSQLFEGLDISQTHVISQNADGTYTVPSNYYVISTDAINKQQTIAQIPHGYIVDSTGKLAANTKVALYSTSQTGDMNSTNYTINDISKGLPTRYDRNNYDMEYHADPTMVSDDVADTLAQTGTWVIDKSGKKVLIPWSDISNNIIYYTPGSYPFGPSNYVPNYEDSIYLSQTTGISQAGPVTSMAAIKGGFCSEYKDYPNELETRCNALDVNACGSTSCCVLFGGTKCVAGDRRGPTINANYSDVFVRNKDVYYYQGKCYGNCFTTSF